MISISYEGVGKIAEDHMAKAFQKAIDSSSGSKMTLLDGGGFRLVTGCAHPLGNFAMPTNDEQTEESAKILADSGFPCAMLFPGSSDPEKELGLSKFGFEFVGAMPAMAAEIERIPQAHLPAGYQYKRLTSDEDNSNWAQALAIGYGLPLELADLFSPSNITLDDAAEASVQFFQVTHEGQIVGVSVMILDAGVAGIYCVATIPEHRGKGIGALITAEPLRQAAKLGYKVGVLQASEKGYSVYRKLGFEDRGTIRMYVRLPE